MTDEMKKDFTELAELMVKLSTKYQSVYFQTAHSMGEETPNSVTVRVEEGEIFEYINIEE